jgi:murein tripeptide amidase MpaA
MILSILFVFISIHLSLSAEISTTDFGYHHYNDLSSLLRNYSVRFPTKTHLYSIGKSVQGRDLWVMAIAERNPDRHEIMRPEAKYIGNMHGNESPSREVVLHFLDYMLNNEASDPSVQFLMKSTRIHVMPTMNPDGFEGSIVTDCSSVHGRYNANNFDLNRNFPDHFENNAVPIQPETSAVMQWLAANDFVLSANMHEGSLVVNYPYDNYANSFDGLSMVSLCDDDDVFRAMALNYTANNVEMRSNQIQCNIGESFVNGTTNGG